MLLLIKRTTDDVNLSVLRCYLLIRHYCAAIMWSAGIKPAEPHCTLKTIQIMREIIESPVHNADGSGAMLVIRIPSMELANLAFESLKNTRDRLVLCMIYRAFSHGHLLVDPSRVSGINFRISFSISPGCLSVLLSLFFLNLFKCIRKSLETF